MIVVNQLLKEQKSEKVFRVLWIDSHSEQAYLIDAHDGKAFPFRMDMGTLKEEIIHDRLVKIKTDPYTAIKEEEYLSEKSKRIRDQVWEAIKEIVYKEPEIYDRTHRGRFVNQTEQKYHISKPTLYRYLRRYWQRGKNPNALLPDYDNSGGKGKIKVAGNAKRGRPYKYATDNEGMNIGEKDRENFANAIRKYYLNPKKISLNTVYQLMIKEYYSKDFYYDDNIKTMVIEEVERRPTLGQFKYWFYKEYNPKQIKVSRLGEKSYNKDHRAVLGSSTHEVEGPGSRYQIDATIADVYLVSRFNRAWIIGRPVIYLVIDVFSRMIVGMHVGLKGPSWEGAMMALANAATDKVTFCKEYEIEITENQWPCVYLPDVILADRGELEGTKVETLIHALNVRVENTASYRADWKGIVERHFRTMQGKVKPFTPGFIDIDFRQRGGKDYRLDAKVDVFQFTQILIHYVLTHNNHKYQSNYPLSEDMIADNVAPIPLNLWNWGIANRSGKLRSFSTDIIKLNLMHRGNATVTYQGIKFKNMYYGCELALKEYWFDTARQKGNWKVEISYDPRDVEFIYIRKDKGKDFVTCRLLDHQEKYIGRSIDEVEYLHEYQKMNKIKQDNIQLQHETDLSSKIQSIVKIGDQMTKEAKSQVSKQKKIKDIRDHRKHEAEKMDEKEAFVLGVEKEKKIEMVETKQEKAELQNVRLLQLIKEKQRKNANERREN